MEYKIDQALIVSGGRMPPGYSTVLRMRKVDGIDNVSFMKLFDYKHFHILCGAPRESPYKESVRLVVAEIKQLRNESLIEATESQTSAIAREIGIDPVDPPVKKARAKSKPKESATTITIPARGDLPPLVVQVVAPRRRDNAIEIEASQTVIEHVVSMVLHEIANWPLERLEGDSSEGDCSSASSDGGIGEGMRDNGIDGEGTIV